MSTRKEAVRARDGFNRSNSGCNRSSEHCWRSARCVQGSLTRQYKDPQHHVGAYWQISYTRRMKSRTEYVRKEWVKEVRRQIATHKRFKRLIDRWLDLSIEHSQLTMQTTKPKAN